MGTQNFNRFKIIEFNNYFLFQKVLSSIVCIIEAGREGIISGTGYCL